MTCSNRGECVQTTGSCSCFAGYAGSDCSRRQPDICGGYPAGFKCIVGEICTGPVSHAAANESCACDTARGYNMNNATQQCTTDVPAPSPSPYYPPPSATPSSSATPSPSSSKPATAPSPHAGPTPPPPPQPSASPTPAPSAPPRFGDRGYTTLNPRYTVGLVIASNAPLFEDTSGTPTNFTVSPEPPKGLAFDTHTGAITGKPANLTVVRVYTVRAANEFGFDSYELRITVVDVRVCKSRTRKGGREEGREGGRRMGWRAQVEAGNTGRGVMRRWIAEPACALLCLVC